MATKERASMGGSGDGRGVVAVVSAATSAVAAQPHRSIERLLKLLDAQLPTLGYREGDPLLVVLPPGWVALAAMPRLNRRGLVQGLLAHKRTALGPLATNIGRAPLRTAALLGLHGVQQDFLWSLKAVAEKRGLAFVGPSSWSAHPRTHWERWPDSAHAFHQVWSVAAEPDLHAVRHNRPPLWMQRAGVMQSDSQPRPELHTGLPAPLDRLTVYFPRLITKEPMGSFEPSRPAEPPRPVRLECRPWFGRTPELRRAHRFEALGEGAIALSAGLDAPAVVAIGGTDGYTVYAKTPPGPGPDGVQVVATAWPLG